MPPAFSNSAATVNVDGVPMRVTSGTAPGYVADSECIECHAAIHATFQDHGMWLSAHKPSEDRVIEDFSNNHFFHKASQRHYEMRLEDGRMSVRRYQLDDEGLRYNEVEEEVDFIIGSGHHSRSYVFRTSAGELFQLPIVWYTPISSWRMAPGYDLPVHFGFTRVVTRRCMFCHNAYPDVPVGRDRDFQPHLFPPELPEGIGCQRCHGPGAKHVGLTYERDSRLREIRSSIYNPQRDDSGRRPDEVCLQCHLQTTSDLSLIVSRFDRGTFAFTPDQPLGEYATFLEYEGGGRDEERFEINQHADRMFNSKCFTGSGGALSCLTCHDPHRKIKPEEIAAYYREKCLTCHEVAECGEATSIETAHSAGDEKASALANCIPCHMPERRTHDVIQSTVTDHLIRSKPPTDGWLAMREERPDLAAVRVTRYPHDVSKTDPMFDLYAAKAMGQAGRPANVSAIRETIDRTKPKGIEPYLYLAAAQLTAGRRDDAMVTLTDVLKREPNSTRGLYMMGRAWDLLGQPEKAIPNFQKAVGIDPYAAGNHNALGMSLLKAGRLDESIGSFENAVRLHPYDASAWLGMAGALVKKGDYQEAAEAFTEALRSEPNLRDAYLSLGLCQLVLGQTPDAVRTWKRGRSVEPDDADLCEALAAGLVLAGRNGEALETAEEARRLGADEASCLLTEGLAFQGLGRVEEARVALRAGIAEAERTSPSVAAIRSMLIQRARRLAP